MKVRREIALGLSPDPQFPVFYTFGIFQNLRQKLTLPFIRVVPPKGNEHLVVMLSQRNRFGIADMGLMEKLSPYQKHLLDLEMGKFATIYSETPRPERMLRPKPRR